MTDDLPDLDILAPAVAGFAGIRIGHWSNLGAATGCTVLLAPSGGMMAAASVLGGAPGTRETDLLRPGTLVERIDAILLTGGSAFGLNAAAGVMRYLEEHGAGFPTSAGRVPIVVGAVLYDLGVGDSRARPGDAEGYAACEAAVVGATPEGSVGAGTGATVAKAGGVGRALKGGLGIATEHLTDGTSVSALAAVNAFGDIVDPETGRHVAMPRPNADGGRRPTLDLLRERPAPVTAPNTTLVVVATTARLTRDQLQRVAEMAHSGIARAVEPSHTPVDGDTVFAVSTGLGPALTDPRQLLAVGALGARAVSSAIVRGVTVATGLAGVPAVRNLAD